MRQSATTDPGAPGHRYRLPELAKSYSAEQDPIQRLFDFAYRQAQKGRREAEEELRKDADCLSAVIATQDWLASTHLNLEQSLDFIIEQARRITGAGGAAIALREGQDVVCRARSGLIAPELGACLDPHSGISGTCLRTGEIQQCDDTETDQQADMWVCRNLGIRSILAVPLRRQQDVLGILEVFSGWAGVFSERDIRTLRLLAGLIMEALWSQQVRERQVPLPEPVRPMEASLAPAGTVECVPLSVAVVEPLKASKPFANVAQPKPVSPGPGRAEPHVPVQMPANYEVELPVPMFEVLGGAEPQPLWRVLKIGVVALAVLVAGSEVVVWRGLHIQEILHIRNAGFAPRTSEVTPTPSVPAVMPAGATRPPETVVGTVPETASSPAPIPRPAQVLSIRFWSKPEGTTVAVFLTAPARWESGVLTGPERIYFDLENTQLSAEMSGRSKDDTTIQVNDEIVNRIRVGIKEPGAVRILIYLAAAGREYSAVFSPNEPYRLMIAIRGRRAPKSAPADAASAETGSQRRKPRRRVILPSSAIT